MRTRLQSTALWLSVLGSIGRAAAAAPATVTCTFLPPPSDCMLLLALPEPACLLTWQPGCFLSLLSDWCITLTGTGGTEKMPNGVSSVGPEALLPSFAFQRWRGMGAAPTQPAWQSIDNGLPKTPGAAGAQA